MHESCLLSYCLLCHQNNNQRCPDSIATLPRLPSSVECIRYWSRLGSRRVAQCGASEPLPWHSSHQQEPDGPHLVSCTPSPIVTPQPAPIHIDRNMSRC